MFDRAIRQAIDRHPQTLTPETPVSDAIARLSQNCKTTVFICDRRRLVGAFGETQLLHLVKNPDFDRTQPVGEVMVQTFPRIRESQPPEWDTLSRWFENTPLQALPVLDNRDRLVGSLPQRALLREAADFRHHVAKLQKRIDRETAEQELLQEKLATSYSQLRTILSAMQDIVLEIDLDGDRLEVGLPSPDPVDPDVSLWIDRTISCFFEDGYADDFLQQIRQALQTRQTVRFEYSLPDGESPLWFEARISPIAQTSVVWVARNANPNPRNDRAVLWVARDITARKQAEDAIKTLASELERRVEARTAQLRSTNEILRAEIRKRQQTQQDLQHTNDRMRAVLDAIPGFVSWIGSDGRYQGVNRHLATAYGLDPEDFVSRDVGFQGSNAQFSEFVRQFLDSDGRTAGRVIDTPIGETLRQYLVVAQKYDRGRAAVTVGIDITERKQFEIALQKQQRLVQQIADATPDVLYVYDLLAERNVYVNRQVTQLLGYTPERIQAMSSQFLSLVVHPDDIYSLSEQRERFAELAEDDVSEREFRVRGADGDWRWIHSRETILTRTADGTPEQIVGIAQDVTVRKQAEEALRQLNQELEAKVAERTVALQRSEAKFRSLFEQMAVGVAQVDLQGHWQFVNQKLCDILGYSAEELGRTGCLEMTHPEDLEITRQCLHNLLSDRVNTCALEKRYQKSDGSLVWTNVTISVVRDTSETEYGSLPSVDPYFVAVVQDISDRKQAEAALKQQTEILQTIVDRIPVAICFLGSDETPQLVNRCFEETLGWSLQEVRTINLFAACYPNPDDRQQVLDYVRAAAPGWQDFTVCRRDGHPLEMSWANVRLSDGTTIGFGQDVTERKRAETEVIKAIEKERELIDLKSRFVSMTSHEFRTPLAVIQSSAQLLHRYEWSREEQLEQLDQIQSAVRHMTELLDDVLTFAKSEAGTLNFNPSEVELTEFCQRLTTQLSNSIGRDRAFAKELPHQPLWIRADEKLLRQILSNLLSNALKYSPPEAPVRFALWECDGQIVFEIEDRGIGIPPEDLPRLFESFHRAKNVGTIPGTGLGLAIVKRCVDLHGGTIEVDSESGRGTQVTVVLPTTTDEETLANRSRTASGEP
ncbi:PAS domain S-box protein [Baaleninema simplex]|uniref:PAS domain S-box protein n=1 Tax=Baaleninema simplex TaxID=2862350 RepID=UPI000347ECA2|nr:PAS domain S-box protein [Baaleninema simplex]